MAERKYDRRFDLGSTFPLRTSTNEPTRSMGSLATPVLMKPPRSKNLDDEASEKRRREAMSHQLRVPSLPSKGMLLGASVLSKSAAGTSDLPTITGKRPLPKALLPKEARKNSYQPVISGPFAFTSGLNVTTGPAYGMQRRSSFSGCYPLRPSANVCRSERVPNGTDAERGSTASTVQATDDTLRRLSLDRARRNSVNTLSPPPNDGNSQISLSRDREEGAVGRRDVDTESIYPMLRDALGKDANDEDYSVLRRNYSARPSAAKKERPASYADPHSFQKMHEDLQTPYAANSPSYNPPSGPTKTSLDTDAIVISESSSIDKMPNLQRTDFERMSDSIPLSSSARKSAATAFEDKTYKVSCLSDEVKPQSDAGQTTTSEALYPSTTGLKQLDETSPNKTEPKIQSPVTERTEMISSKTTKPKIQSLVTIKSEAISTDNDRSNRLEWFSPIPASPRRVIKSPRLSSGSQEKAEISSPAYSCPSSKFTDSPIENPRQPRSVFSFEMKTNPLPTRDSSKHDDTQSHTDYPEADQKLITKENNYSPSALSSTAPPPLPVTSPLTDDPMTPSTELHLNQECSRSSDTIPDNSFNKLISGGAAVETSPPALPSSAPPPLPVTSPPTGAPIIPITGLHHDQEYGSSSDTIPYDFSNKRISNSTTVETAPPALPSSAPPPLPVTSPPAYAPIISDNELPHKDSYYKDGYLDKTLENSSNVMESYSTTVEPARSALPSRAPAPLPANSPPTAAPDIHTSELHNQLKHGTSSDTNLENCSNEAARRSEHGTTTDRNTDGMEQSELVGRRLHRQSLSSEESLLDGHETKSGSARNGGTMSPTLSDADSGIDSVKQEHKRSYETVAANEEYQAVLWDEQSETIGVKSDIAASQFLCDSNKNESQFTDTALSNITPASVEPQQATNSDCGLSSSDIGRLPTQIETGSDQSQESASLKAITFDKETDESMHESRDRKAKIAFSADEKKANFGDLPPTPNPPPEIQILTTPDELSNRSDITSAGQQELTTVHIQKGIMGLGFSVQGGQGSAYGDRPLTVKKIFKAGDASVKEMLSVGDEIICANGKDLSSCSLHEAWNYLKTLPDGTLDIVIRRASNA